MKTFKEFLELNESPSFTGTVGGESYSKEDVYNSYKEHNTKFNIISDDVGNGKYILKEYNQTFYLVDAVTDEYLGNIQYIHRNNMIFIKTAHSKIKGFYGMVFVHIFKDTDIKYIFGDSGQSTQARKAWDKIIGSFDKAVVIDLSTNQITPYDPQKADEYWGDYKGHIRIGITDDKKLIQERFDSLKERINEDTEDGVLRKMNKTKDINLDMYFYPNNKMEL